MKHGQAGVAGNLAGFVAGESGGKPHALQTLRAKPGEPSRPSNLSFNRFQPNSTHFNRFQPAFLKKIMRREHYATARNGRYNPAVVVRAWGWQNEAKTKPFYDAAGAINGRAGLAKRLCLHSKAAFQPVLRRGARHGGNLQNEAICFFIYDLRYPIYEPRGVGGSYGTFDRFSHGRTVLRIADPRSGYK